MKIGELARQTGISVRALHHYDRIGLLRPSQRTRAGHRLYGKREIVRLQQVTLLRQLGFSLREIQECLQRRRFSPAHVLELHLARLSEQIEQQGRLRRRLEVLHRRLVSKQEVSTEEFLATIREVTMLEKYYTPEQREKLKQRREQVGEERIRQVEAEWTQLFEQFRAQRRQGSDPASPPVQELAHRALALVREFTGGDAGIARSLGRMYQQEGGPRVMAQHGIAMEPDLWAYMQKAMAAARTS